MNDREARVIKITRIMLEMYPPPQTSDSSGGPDFGDWSISDESKRLYESNPNALLLAAIMDRHVARVFMRSGLIAARKGQTQYSVSELREQIIARARELSPQYPAALDPPAFNTGMRWCTEREARCDDGSEPCPLSKVCTKRIRHYRIV
jgi:hypothetical protein